MTYPGGKNGSGVYQRIINQIPPHQTYIEPFLGGGAILLNKKPAYCSIGIDADPAVIYIWQHIALYSTPVTIPNLTVFQGDAIRWLEDAELPESTFIYCDPPYLLDTRKSKNQLYLFEMGDEERHTRLLEALLKLDCMIMLSGYWSDLYAARLKDWRTISFEAMTRGGTLAMEYLWMNYPQPQELHDYRYLGDDFRDRERIKRKLTRWKRRLAHMDNLERLAMFAAIDETRQQCSSLPLSLTPTMSAAIAGSIDAVTGPLSLQLATLDPALRYPNPNPIVGVDGVNPNRKEEPK